jgi:hypothetical protein
MGRTAAWTAALAVVAGMALGTAATASADPEFVTVEQCQEGGGYPDFSEEICRGGKHDGAWLLID